MRLRSLVLVAFLPGLAGAQSLGDVSAAIAMQRTPLFGIGAFRPEGMVDRVRSGRQPITYLYSYFRPDGGGTGDNSFGASFFTALTETSGLAADISITSPGCVGCPNGVMAGLDYVRALWASKASTRAPATTVSVQMSGGYGRVGSDDNFFSLVGVLPLAVRLNPKLGVAAGPTFGWGMDRFSGTSESGTRAGGIAALAWHPSPRLTFRGGASKVILDSFGMNYFLSATVGSH